jgi:putative transposase
VSGRKRHLLVDTALLVDTDGRLLRVLVHRANIPEREGARMLLDKLRSPAGRLELIWADAGYSGSEIAGWVKEQHGVRVEIVSKIAPMGFDVLPRRWVVKRIFGWWNKWRRLSKDFEQNPRSSEAWIHIVMIAIMINRIK